MSTGDHRTQHGGAPFPCCGLTRAAPPPWPRTALLSEMRKAAQACSSVEAALREAWEAHVALAGAVEQRLKWAGGANPALADTRHHFDQLLDQWTSITQV